MNKLFIAWSGLSWLALALTVMSDTAFATDCPADIKAVTNTDVKVPIEVLSYRLKPLTKCGLAAEAQADIKTALIKHVTVLMAERTALIDRFNTVLAELSAKGGNTGEYDSYIKAVSGIKVDVTAASATLTTITGWLMSPEGGIRWAVNMIQFMVIVFHMLSVVAGKAAKGQPACSRKAGCSMQSTHGFRERGRLFLPCAVFPVTYPGSHPYHVRPRIRKRHARRSAGRPGRPPG